MHSLNTLAHLAHTRICLISTKEKAHRAIIAFIAVVFILAGCSPPHPHLDLTDPDLDIAYAAAYEVCEHLSEVVGNTVRVHGAVFPQDDVYVIVVPDADGCEQITMVLAGERITRVLEYMDFESHILLLTVQGTLATYLMNNEMYPAIMVDYIIDTKELQKP